MARVGSRWSGREQETLLAGDPLSKAADDPLSKAVGDLLATKLSGTPLEGHVEVIAQVSGETEKRLLPSFRL